jgi:hypothetical protein
MGQFERPQWVESGDGPTQSSYRRFGWRAVLRTKHGNGRVAPISVISDLRGASRKQPFVHFGRCRQEHPLWWPSIDRHRC